MGMGGGGMPAPSAQETQLQEEQRALTRQQSQYLQEQSLIQRQQRERLMRDASVTAAQGARAFSRARRQGMFGGGSLITAGYGGFSRGGQARSMTGGVRRDYAYGAGARQPAPGSGATGPQTWQMAMLQQLRAGGMLNMLEPGTRSLVQRLQAEGGQSVRVGS